MNILIFDCFLGFFALILQYYLCDLFSQGHLSMELQECFVDELKDTIDRYIVSNGPVANQYCSSMGLF